MLDLENLKTKGIITKPHFDSNFYKVGKAYYISKIGLEPKEYNSLLVDSNPNLLKFYCFDSNAKKGYYIDVIIEDVLKGTITILPMQPDINYI